MRLLMRKGCVGILVMLTLGGAASVVSAQTQPPAASDSSAEASYLLNYMAQFLSGLKQFSVTIRADYDVVQESGEKVEFGEIRKVVVVRPDRLRVDIERSDGDKGTVVFDGKEITVYNDKAKVFATASRPGDIDGAIMYFLKDLQMRLPLAMMLVTSLPSEMESRVRSVNVVEQSTLFDVPCVHLGARTDQVDFQVWIQSKGAPLPRRVVITYKDAEGQPQFRADISDWSVSPKAPESLFTFTPPEGAKRIAFLSELLKVQKASDKKGGKK